MVSLQRVKVKLNKNKKTYLFHNICTDEMISIISSEFEGDTVSMRNWKQDKDIVTLSLSLDEPGQGSSGKVGR